MSRSERLLRLLQLLRSLPAPATAARLAAETGVSMRTLYRDIESLRASGARIEGAPGFGYTLREDPALPPQMFDRLEMEALVLGLAGVAADGDPELARAAAGALAKVVATLPERIQQQAAHAIYKVHRFETHPPIRVDPAILRRASWEERALDIVYCDAADARTRRRVWPLSLVFLERTLKLLAWCRLREDFRTFNVERIEAACATEESFRPRRAALLRAMISGLRSRNAPGAGG